MDYWIGGLYGAQTRHGLLRLIHGVGVANLYIKPQRLHFFDQDVEGLGDAGFKAVVAFHDALVDPGAPLDVVGFDGEEFLERVGGAVGFHGPDFHFAEALAAVLGFAAQRLLRDEGIRTDGASVNLIRHEMAELHHIDVANHDLLVELLAGAAIEEIGFAVLGQAGLFEIATNLFLFDAVEDRSGISEAEQFGRPAQVRFQHLADVHTRRHAQRVEDDVHRRSIGEERHVFFGDDFGDDAFIAVTACHLVTHRELALRGDIDFDRLDDTAIGAFAGFGALDLFVVLHLDVVELLFEAADDFVDFVADGRGIDFDAVINHRQFAQQGLGDLAVGGDDDFARLAVDDVEWNFLAEQDVAERLGELLAQLIDFLFIFLFDFFGVALLLGGVHFGFFVGLLFGGDFYVHDNAIGARGNLEGGVFYVSGFLAEDGAQQAFFGSQLGLALGRDFADQDVAGMDLRADADNAIGTQVFERLVTEIGDVPSDFLGPELGVAGADFEFIDMDRGEDVVFDDAFADENGVLEVVAVPRHEGDEHVAAEGQFSALGARTIGDDLAFFDRLALVDDDLLVDAGRGVGAHEFADLIDPNALGGIVFKLLFAVGQFSVLGNDNLASGKRGDFAGLLGDNDGAGIAGDPFFQAGGDQRRFRHQQWHGLGLP